MSTKLFKQHATYTVETSDGTGERVPSEAWLFAFGQDATDAAVAFGSAFATTAGTMLTGEPRVVEDLDATVKAIVADGGHVFGVGDAYEPIHAAYLSATA